MTDEDPQPLPPAEQPPAASQPASLWLTGLTQEHYAPLFQLAQASLEDEQLARQVARTTLTQVFLQAARYKPRRDPNWLYELCLKEIRPNARTTTRSGRDSPPDQQDAAIWKLVDSFEQKERLLCILLYLLDWAETPAAALLKVSAAAVRAQRQLFEQRFTAVLYSGPNAVTLREGAALARLVSASLHRRWPAPSLTAADLAEIIAQIQGQAADLQARPRRLPVWLLPAGAGLLLVLACLGLGVLAYLAGLTPTIQFPGAAQPISTPRQAARQAWPLSLLSSSAAISQRLLESSELWSTLWMDVQETRFGPPSYRGAPRQYRLQAWISQPTQSIQLFGLLAADPASLYIYRGWRGNYFNPLLGKFYTKEAAAAPAALLENGLLRQMVYPATSIAVIQPGYFRAVRPEALLGRQALVVDWRNQYGQRLLRLWIDTRTGILLRQQEFGGEAYDLLLGDSLVTELILDQAAPPARLTTEMQKIQQAASATDDPTTIRIILPTPTSALPLENRATLGRELPPPGYDPRHARLNFEFPNNLEYSNAWRDTAQIPITLYADGYWMGETRFGLPWLLRCARSPDGLRLAFNTGSDAASLPDEALRWLDLREPGKLYEPLPGLPVNDFAFTADSMSLAASVTSQDPEQAGLYLVSLATGEARQIIPLASARSLLWSPDGEFLALIGTEQPEEAEQALIVHLRSGQIAFRADPLPLGAALPDDWPIANWGLAFPVAPGDLQTCANPPAQ